jgi:pheromone shutdown protein TraB
MYRFRNRSAYVWFLVAGALAALGVLLADGALKVACAVVVVAIIAAAVLSEVAWRRRNRV